MLFGLQELILIAVVFFLLFGGKSLANFARSLGKAKKEFQKGLKDGLKEEEKSDLKED